ncbi:ModD protein [Thiomonas bhubaneswarensis]|uniref:Putative pyrophosphorylase ModD n=1 Tax=Thiomonas bhubaneswarensis TaxID=339866 RepID=A0A0K6HRM1_9BURK|nr:ModD protein [Thiomonas bhubaneswarensis]CUA93677.1 putative molybdenum utilization protein ModD [Thiomonas bhubaneswarensis]
MMHFSQAEIDQLIFEDVPLHDETTRALGLPDAPGSLTYTARQHGVIAGMAPLLRMAQALGLRAEPLAADGDATAPGQAVLQLHGGAHALHMAWKQGMNLLEYLGGIASATRQMVEAARVGNPRIQVAGTRKAHPGARRLQHYAVLCGGGMVHRAGLSETILVFAQHRAFLPGLDAAALVARAKAHSPEKFVLIEAESAEDALTAARAGADGVQLDKMTPKQLATLVPQLRALQPRLTINAAGGIRPDNAAEFAASGVDILVTSSLYNAKAADFGAVMRMD